MPPRTGDASFLSPTPERTGVSMWTVTTGRGGGGGIVSFTVSLPSGSSTPELVAPRRIRDAGTRVTSGRTRGRHTAHEQTSGSSGLKAADKNLDGCTERAGC